MISRFYVFWTSDRLSAARRNEHTNAFRNFPITFELLSIYSSKCRMSCFGTQVAPIAVMQAKRWLEIETLDGAIAAVRFAD